MSVPVSKTVMKEGSTRCRGRVQTAGDGRENCEFGYDAAAMSDQSNTADLRSSLRWTRRIGLRDLLITNRVSRTIERRQHLTAERSSASVTHD